MGDRFPNIKADQISATNVSIGKSTTPAQNVKIHRSGSGEVQFVQASANPADGTSDPAAASIHPSSIPTIVESMIGTGAVTANKIGTNAVTEIKILNDAVTETKIKNDAVTVNKLASNSVTNSKIASGAVIEAKIGTGAVTNTKLGTNAVTQDKIADNSVGTNEIINSNVTNAKLGPDCVNASKIADNAVQTEHILNGAVTNAKLGAANIVHSAEQDGTVSTSGAYVPVPSWSATITTTGRPVMISFAMNEASAASQIGAIRPDGNPIVRFKRNGTIVNITKLEDPSSLGYYPPGILNFINAPGPGSHTYTVEINQTMFISLVRMTLIEL